MLAQVGQIPAPAEAPVFGVGLALQQQQLGEVALVGDQLLEGHLQGAELGLQQPGGAIGIDAIEQAKAAVLEQ